uniref:Uncharacterized protein n=1 Tax=Rhizophora mucronata TaxID=61149 RepID=A0A2P2PEZ4_RHIMU
MEFIVLFNFVFMNLFMENPKTQKCDKQCTSVIFVIFRLIDFDSVFETKKPCPRL